MRKPASLMRLFSTAVITGMIVFADARAEKIIWVTSNYDVDADGVQNDQPFIDVLTANGYDVQVEIDSLKGIPLTAEQIAVLESADLIIVSRATGSGDYNDPDGWNSITKPMIVNNVYMPRISRWQWLNTDALIGGGDSGSPLFYADMPDHPIFAGVDLDADGTVAVLDGSVGTGHTSLFDYTDYGDGELIASVAETGTIAIVYWQTDAAFDGPYYAGGPRLLFSCQTRESGTFGIGLYNLTSEGEKMYLNAVAFMLGKDTGVSEKTGTSPADFTLGQNFPNPFNPSTRIVFSLPSSGMTKISVHNLRGQGIAILEDKILQAGTHEVAWNGCDRSGHPMPAGVYLYRMITGGRIQVRKMSLIR